MSELAARFELAIAFQMGDVMYSSTVMMGSGEGFRSVLRSFSASDSTSATNSHHLSLGSFTTCIVSAAVIAAS
jgi:hypothetical protein